MKKIKLSFFLLLMLTSGCASVSDQMAMNKFSEASRAYGDAILWSHYEVANLYRRSSAATGSPPDFEKLQNIKVAMYDVKQVDLSEDKRRVSQIVEIKYYKMDNMIIKIIRDEQVWEYDAKDDRWYLTSGLPQFK